jgi:hypothetical protein
MIQPTSQEAYRRITDSTILQRLHRTICGVLLSQYTPMTAGEIAEAMRPTGRINSVSPRMRELRRMGVVMEFTARPCRVTGRLAIAWGLTGKEPVLPAQGRPELERCVYCNGTGKVRTSLAG